jgi:hypothetical protein
MKVDRSHNLTELSRRVGKKPYDSLQTDEGFPAERTIFHDAVTDAEIWKLTHDPETSRHIY